MKTITEKKEIASKLRKLADDMEDISKLMSERIDAFKEYDEWLLYSSELAGSSEIVMEWADQVETEINNQPTDQK